jgi:hypothetical protein
MLSKVPARTSMVQGSRAHAPALLETPMPQKREVQILSVVRL